MLDGDGEVLDRLVLYLLLVLLSAGEYVSVVIYLFIGLGEWWFGDGFDFARHFVG